MGTIVRHPLAVTLVAIASALLGACSSSDPGAEDTATGAAAEGIARASRDPAAPQCYRSDVSVLLGPSRGGTSEGTPPGWIRLEGLGADSGMARLTDAGGAGLHAQWRRVEGDSIHLAGFDDFLRVEMRLAAGRAQVSGRATATSDAGADRDAAGRPTDLRREWSVAAAPAACDSMPAAEIEAPR